jgi:hypothetical protein
MENLKQIIIKNVDLSLDYWSMFEKFLIQWEEDAELSETLKDVTVSDIEPLFLEIYKTYYLPDKQVVEKETTFNEFKTYNKYNLVHALNINGDHLIFNATTGVMLSKTSMEKFLKKYSIDDVTRVRLYCMFHNHVRPDDDFVKVLNNSGVKWKRIEIKNKHRIYSRFPQISI